MYIKAAKISGVGAVAGIALHLLSHGYVRAEYALAEKFTATKAAVIQGLAEDFGYERKVELEQLTFEDLAEKEALVHGLNPALVRAVMHVESRGKEFAESPLGARGPLQIMPANYKRCGLPHHSKLWVPNLNIKCGVQILAEELRTYNGNVFKALIAYNAGPRGVTGNYPVSVAYAQDVLSRMAQDIR